MEKIKNNLANIITLTRIFLVFVVAGLLFCDCYYSYIWALVLTAILMWFDGLDGFVARKLKISSKMGALLDIMGDRIVENVFWITFCALGLINVIIPLVVVTRGIITDSIRTLAFKEGYTAFGSDTMMQGKVTKFIVASNFSRFTYAVCKAVAFFLLILGNIPSDFMYKAEIYNIGVVLAIISTIFCVLRGLPVVLESGRFFK